jgi:hypothetical protein
MPSSSPTAPVPFVDRALGGLVTFAGGALVGFVAAVVLAPDPTGSALLVPLAAGALAGTAAAGTLVYAGGYDRLLVPVEGRRWTVELAFAVALVLLVLSVADALSISSDALVVAVVALAVLGTRRVGDAVADAFDWYDRDAAHRDQSP